MAVSGPDSFGVIIRRSRIAAGLTQEELAELTGLSVRAIGDIERDRTIRPRRCSVELLARALQLTTACERTVGGPARGVVPRQLPGPVPHFVGRATELRMLDALLENGGQAPGTVVISAIGGTAGVGKTALALHWANQVTGRFPDGQLYVNLRGFGPSGPPRAAADALYAFLHTLAVPAEQLPADLEESAALYRSTLAGRRMLVMLDNAYDAEQVRPLLPASPGCLVVITSRRQLTGLVATNGAFPLVLDVLSEMEAGELLARKVGAGRLAAEPEAAEDLARMCARLPLALSIAAARAAARPGMPLAVMAEELRDTHSRLDALDTEDLATSVRGVFSWSYRQLGTTQARMFRLLGIHPDPDVCVPAAASLAGVPVSAARRSLGQLARAGLLAESAYDRFSCHDLLRTYAAELALATDSRADRDAALHRALDYYLHTACAAGRVLYPARRPIPLAAPQPGVLPGQPSDPADALGWLDTEHRVLCAAVALAAERDFDIHASRIAWALEPFFHSRGHWHDWASTQRIPLQSARRLGDPQAQAAAHRGIASALIALARYPEALQQLDRALELRELAGDLAGQARIQLDIGRVLDATERSGEALGHAREGVRLAEADGDLDTQADAYNHVGWYLARTGQYQQALHYCGQAVDLHRRLGNKHGEAPALHTKGYAYSGLGRHADAVGYYERAATLYVELGHRHDLATVLTDAGDAYSAEGNDAAARGAWTRALGILAELQHPDAEGVQARLASHLASCWHAVHPLWCAARRDQPSGGRRWPVCAGSAP